MLLPNILAVAAAVVSLVSAIPAPTGGNLAPEVIADPLPKRGLGRPIPFRQYAKRPREPSPSPPRPRPRPARRDVKGQVLAESLEKRGLALPIPFRQYAKRPREPSPSPPRPRPRPARRDLKGQAAESLDKRGLVPIPFRQYAKRPREPSPSPPRPRPRPARRDLKGRDLKGQVAESLDKRGLVPIPFRQYAKRPREPSPSPPRPRPRPARRDLKGRDLKGQVAESLDKRALMSSFGVRLNKADGKRPRPPPDVSPPPSPPLSPRLRPDVSKSILKRGVIPVGRPVRPQRTKSDQPWWGAPPPPPILSGKLPLGRTPKVNLKRDFIADESLEKRGVIRVVRPTGSRPHRSGSDEPVWHPPPQPPVLEGKLPLGRSRKGPNLKRHFIADESLEKRGVFRAVRPTPSRPQRGGSHDPSAETSPPPPILEGKLPLGSTRKGPNLKRDFIADESLEKRETNFGALTNGAAQVPNSPTQKRDVEVVEKDSDLGSDYESEPNE